MIAFTCASCGVQLRVKDELAGKAGKCPSCGNSVQAPAVPRDGAPAAEKATPRAASTPTPAAPAAMDETMDVASKLSAASAPLRRGDGAGKGPLPEEYSFLAPPQGPDELGRLGSYRVLKVLGAGGMGVVFEAEDCQLRRLVALKAMKPNVAGGDQARQRFLREAQTTAAIEHDHIVTIYQVGEDRGIPYLAMKLLQGESLEARLEKEGGWLSLAEVLRIGREIAQGLAAAHRRGLVHRDIKPANVWLETIDEEAGTSRVKIVDFGLARVAEDDTRITQTGTIMGTPAYMAPEQASGTQVDYRCDLFSLGCVLYRISTGQMPFRGKDTMSILMALATHQPEPPSKLDPGLPAAFSDLIMRLLAKDPEERVQSARDVVEVLESVERTLASPAPAAAVAPARTEETSGDLQPLPPSGPAKAPSGEVKRAPSPRKDSKPPVAPAVSEEVEDEEAAEEEEEEEEEPAETTTPVGKKKRKGAHVKKKLKKKPTREGSRERLVIILVVIVVIGVVGLLAFLIIRRATLTVPAALAVPGQAVASSEGGRMKAEGGRMKGFGPSFLVPRSVQSCDFLSIPNSTRS